MRMTRTGGVVALALSALLCMGGCGPTPQLKQTTPEEKAEAQAAEHGNNRDQATYSLAAETQNISLEGVGNSRQLGGYKGEGGRTIKDGVLLRTAALADATDADIERLQNVYHLAEIVDLRMDSEIEASPELEIAGVKNLHLSIMDAADTAKKIAGLSAEGQEIVSSGTDAQKIEIYKRLGIVGDQMYVNYLSSEQGKEGYAKLFQELLALPEDHALLFHCTQGKDRTGCAAMLTLSALGVDEKTIMDDYLLTNEYNAKLIAKERQELIDAGVKQDQLDSLMIAKNQVFPQTMRNVLDWARENYGSMTGYITQELGVTDAQIKALQDKFLA